MRHHEKQRKPKVSCTDRVTSMGGSPRLLQGVLPTDTELRARWQVHGPRDAVRPCKAQDLAEMPKRVLVNGTSRQRWRCLLVDRINGFTRGFIMGSGVCQIDRFKTYLKAVVEGNLESSDVCKPSSQLDYSCGHLQLLLQQTLGLQCT